MTPTNEQIDAAVHEALGHCVHNDIIQYQEIGIHTFLYQYQCAKAECRKHFTDRHHLEDERKIPPYTTDPRLWWPLAEELLKNGHCASWWQNEDGYIIGKPKYTCDCLRTEVGMDKEMGRAVCLAWLKRKGVTLC